MAMALTTDRNDLKGFGSQHACEEWWLAICAYTQENSISEFQTIVGNADGTWEVRFDPDLTEPTLSQFQTQMDTLVSVSGIPGSRTFAYL